LFLPHPQCHDLRRLSLTVVCANQKDFAPAFCVGGGASALAQGNIPEITSPLTANGTVGVAFTYTITATRNPDSYNATPLPAGLSVNTTNGVISGTPTTAGVTNVTISATNRHGTGSATLVITIVAPSFVGFRLPDFLMSAGTPNNPRLMLQMGANGTNTAANRFNATLEVDAGSGTWVPYNHFVGINDPTSWITDAPLDVRDSTALAGTPEAFASAQLTQSPPGVYMKVDPRSTRFGIFQMDTNPTSNPGDPLSSRIVRSVWPTNDSMLANWHGGTVGTTFPGPVEHAPSRFSSAEYYPATFAINGSPDLRDTATTIYADNDNVTRPADAIYLNRSVPTTGSSTPYDTTSTVYRPIILNRPFRNVAELGYAFRDLPWKTLDFFNDKSADAGLLDIFTINDGAQVLDEHDATVGMAPPEVVAGSVNLNSLNVDPNTDQAPAGQSILAGAILDEIGSTTVNKTGTGATDAPVLAKNIVNARSTTPMQNKAELITRAGLLTTILPTAFNDNQAVKARREAVPRAMASVSQTRVWNVMIDVVAQSGRFKPNANNLQSDFIVEGEQHYWVHLAIDRFTGEVLDKQIEVVNE
jgi:hypothetical protein